MFKNISKKKMTKPLTEGLFVALVVAVAWSGIGFSVAPTQTEASAGAVLRTCDVTASAPQIVAGGDITITWVTQGYEVVTLNGETVAPSGSKVFTNIQENSTYTLIAKTADGKSECVASVTVVCVPPPAPLPTCSLTPTSRTINSGETVTLTWTSSNGSGATLSGFGSVPLAGSRTTPPLFANTTYTLTITAEAGTVTCNSVITVIIPPPPAPNCELTPASITIKEGETVTLTWSTENAKSATLTDFGTVPLAGSRTTPALFSSKIYTLNVVGNDNSTVSCLSIITVTKTPPPDPLPVCESFSANPSTINRGSSSTLSWVTKNAARVVIDNGIGEVTATGSLSVSPLVTTTYTLTAYKSPGSNDKDTCTTTIVVKELPPVLPKCESFTATPNNLPFGGGTVVLSWSTRNADTVTITPNIGVVAAVGSSSVALSTSTTYTLVAASGLNSDTFAGTITVAPPVVLPISCAANVTVGVSPTSITRGNNATLSWSTTGVTAVSWNQGITATGLSGSVTVAPTTNPPYILTATDGKDTITCPVTLTVTTGGGGGGGSSSPTCELTVRDGRLSRGQETTLRWNSSRASDVVIVDSFGNTLVTTKNLTSGEKINLYSGSLRIAPTADTTYTMTVSRGSTERVCTAKVTIDNPFTVTQIRNQQPLVTSIALTDVPYTGFEAGPLLTFMFYLLLLVWALYVAYLIVIRRDMLAQYGLAADDSHIVANNLTPEEIRPDVFVAKVQAPAAPPYKEVPKDLPIMGQIPVVGYAGTVSTNTLPPQAIALPSAPVAAVSSDEVTVLENQAHAQKALLSSDAIRRFMSTVPANVSREEALNQVIAEAKAQYPVEDGWIVINEERMRAVCLACMAPARSTVSPFMPTVIPEGSSSLAEAIVTGNVVAAYEMIGHRPMFALADAAADLDAIYRLRRGEEANVSALLEAETAALSDEKILAAIKALTGALDGVYTDEASAVKMAIMKAIKVLA